MSVSPENILIIKYIVAVVTLVAIILAPAYLAAQNDKDKYMAKRIRVASWVFGWTGIGWLLALIWAVKK